MPWMEAALWGVFGSFAVEGLDLYTAVRRHGCWPWRVRGTREIGAGGYAVAELIRLAIGGGLAWAAAASGQFTNAFGALAIGVAAPLIVERLTREIPLKDTKQDIADIADKSTLLLTSRLNTNGQMSVASQMPLTLENEENGQRPPIGDAVYLRGDQPSEVRE